LKLAGIKMNDKRESEISEDDISSPFQKQKPILNIKRSPNYLKNSKSMKLASDDFFSD
jgi:hypothetical protein